MDPWECPVCGQVNTGRRCWLCGYCGDCADIGSILDN